MKPARAPSSADVAYPLALVINLEPEKKVFTSEREYCHLIPSCIAPY